jgi:hypothetical protein
MRKTVFAWVSAPLLAAGCGSQDAECLGKVGGRLGDGAKALLSDSQQRLADSLPAAAGRQLEAKVSRRLKWDKMLANTAIQAQLVDGVLELRGQVRDDDQRRRALHLAEETIGVEQIRDLIEVTMQLPLESQQ